ncbi:NADP-dependent oxidoreductase domain-containing protein, partial [Penicillium cinerascens]
MDSLTLRPEAQNGAMEYTRLGRSGLKISKVVLGAMSFGSDDWMIPEEKALPVIKHAFDNGMNTWDTADIYSFGESERIIAKALKTYNIPRERVVILSKCYGGVPNPGDLDGMSDQEKLAQMAVNDGVMVNRIGLSRKHIFDAVNASIERLGTYLDVLQIHRLDRDTPREEIMRALNDLVDSGKVRYLGASSMFAWEFQALNNIAEKNGWHKFISMQDYYSLLHREEEREMHPYCRDAGVGLIPWSPLARGLLTRPFKVDKAQKSVREASDVYSQMLIGATTEVDISIINRVEELAKKKGCSMAQIGLVWCLKKGVNPIVGLSSTTRVDEAVQSVKLFKDGVLSDGDVQYLDELYVPKAALT